MDSEIKKKFLFPLFFVCCNKMLDDEFEQEEKKEDSVIDRKNSNVFKLVEELLLFPII